MDKEHIWKNVPQTNHKIPTLKALFKEIKELLIALENEIQYL